MSYLVMARKYRPRTFEDVVGQPHIVRTLENALVKGRFAHAYIFYGPRGVGKTTTARILARALNCKNGPTINPCGECPACQEILNGTSMDVLEIDAASNRGIDEMRNLRENVRFTPTSGKFRVYIIDEIHMLTVQAFNALLKTLEEPPSHAVFIGATTEIEQIPRTVLSRVQRFNFRLVSRKEIADYLKLLASKEGIEITDEALDTIAGRANGSLRDGLGLLDQLAAFCEGAITGEEVRNALGVIKDDLYFRALNAVSGDDSAEIFKLVNDLSGVGADPAEFMRGFADFFRDLLLIKSAGSDDLIEGTESHRKKMVEMGKTLSELDIVRLMKLSYDSVADLRRSATPTLGLELKLMQMMKLHDAADLAVMIEQLKSRGVKQAKTGITPQRIPSESKAADEPEPKKAEVTKSESLKKVAPKIESEPEIEITPDEEIPESMSEDLTYAEDVIDSSGDEGSEIDFDIIRDSWGKVVEILKERQTISGNYASEYKPVKFDGETLVIECKNSIILTRVRADIDKIISAIKAVIGMEVKIELVENGAENGKNLLGDSNKSRLEKADHLKEEDTLFKNMFERLDLEPL